jgi:hypothetical protein
MTKTLEIKWGIEKERKTMMLVKKKKDMRKDNIEVISYVLLHLSSS